MSSSTRQYHARQPPVDADEPAAAARRPPRCSRRSRRHGDYLATDHAPHTLAEKERGVSGQPHLDTYGPFVTWLLAEQGFTPERVAAICSANPGLRERLPGEVRPAAAGLRRLADGARLAEPTTVRREDLRTNAAGARSRG